MSPTSRGMGLTLEQVEEACHSQRPHTSEMYEERIRVIAPSRDGGMLTVILAPVEEGVFLPVTARPASRKELALYSEQGGATGG